VDVLVHQVVAASQAKYRSRIHGAMNRLYNDVLAFEASLGLRFDWVLHVGDFGIWPNADEIDKATRKHDGAGDFPQWLEARCEAPRRTLFIKGNHEHFVWLDRQSGTEVLPNLHYLRNGCTFDLTDDHDAIRVGGIGGCYGPSDYERRSNRLQSYARRHYTRDEVETLAGAHGVHIVLTHDAPAGVRFERYRQRISFVSPAIGLDHVLASTRPRVCFFGHHHTRVDAEVAGIRCIGLNKVAGPGNLVAIEMENRTPQWSILGEWP
jgi:predicted phosphohydrolase